MYDNVMKCVRIYKCVFTRIIENKWENRILKMGHQREWSLTAENIDIFQSGERDLG